MPLYEYECGSCRTRFEVRQHMTEASITVCPTCGGPTRRVLFPAGIIFKGSGWYVTDSRKAEPASTPASSEKSGEKSSEKSGEKSTEKSSGENKKDGSTGSNNTGSEGTSKPTSTAGTTT